ncbi:hypothetical protein [Lacticaseibacillus jixiensis]|uniref:hypothetical protein n=1 Tax=Lacticaseibacillus jixiensis TaxID=3231926 RepID=UPI0036F1CF52
MHKGLIGAILGAVLAAAILQWGLGGALLVIVLAAAGYAAESFIRANQGLLTGWLRDGQRRLKDR